MAALPLDSTQLVEAEEASVQSLIDEGSHRSPCKTQRLAIEAACRESSSFSLTLARSIIARAQERDVTPGEARHLLTWSAATWSHARSDIDLCHSLVYAQALFAEHCVCQNRWGPIRKAASQFAQVVGLISDCKKAVQSRPGGLAAILGCSAGSGCWDDGLAQALLDSYGERFVHSGKEAVPSHLAKCFRPLLARAQFGMIDEKLLPYMVKALKRSPEAVLHPVKQFFDDACRCVRWTENVTNLMEEIVNQLRHSNSSRQSMALEAVRSVCRGFDGSDEVEALFAILRSHLEGGKAGGKVTVAAQRVSLYSGVAALSEAKLCMNDFAGRVAEWLSTAAYKSEGLEECKVACIDTLTAWIELVGTSPPSTVIEALKAGIEEGKENLRKAHVRCLLVACLATDGSRQHLDGCVNSLFNKAKAGVSKPASRHEALLAVLAVVQMSSSSLNSLSLSSVLHSGSPLLAPSSWYKVPVEDQKLLARSTKALLDVATVVDPSTRLEAFELTVLMALHPRGSIRSEALHSLGKLLEDDPDNLQEILGGFKAWMLALAGEKEHLPFCYGDIYEEYVPISRVSNALEKLAIKAGANASHAAMIVLSHHQQANKAIWDDSCWRRIAKRVAHVGENIRMKGDALSDSLIDGNDFGLQSAYASVNIAGAKSLRVIGSASDQSARRSIQHLDQIIEESGHNNLSENDLIIWNTPEGILSTDTFEATFRSDSQEKSQDSRKALDNEQPIQRRTKQAHSSGGSEAKGHPDSKGKASQKKDARAVAREAQMNRETSRRNEIQEMKRKLDCVSIAYGALAKGSGGFGKLALSLYGNVLQLLSSPLIGGQAALDGSAFLCSCLAQSPLSRNGRTLAAAYRLVLLDLDPEQGGAEFTSMQGAINAMRQACEEDGALKGDAMELCLPMLKYAILAPRSGEFQRQASEILRRTVEAKGRYPRREVCYLLCSMAQMGISTAHVHNLIHDCADGMESSEAMALLDGALSQVASVRSACLEALKKVSSLGGESASNEEEETHQISARIFLLRYDDNEDVSSVADELWSESFSGVDVGKLINLSIDFLSHENDNVRVCAAKGLAALIKEDSGTLQSTLSKLFSVASEAEDWHTKTAIARTLQECASSVSGPMLPVICNFLIKSLSDEVDVVREGIMDAGKSIIDAGGEQCVSQMLPTFENYFERKSDHGTGKEQERVRSGVVVLMGALGRHLDKSDERVRTILKRQIAALSTPSEVVQRGVADCLPSLISYLEETEKKETFDKLLETLTKTESFEESRGAAYGLTGCVRGCGISSLKSYGVLDYLKNSLEEKKAIAREGALIALQLFVQKLGRLFEPYITQILPLLLDCFSDTSANVRNAASEASRAIMGNLSTQGVKLVLPSVMKGLGDKHWKTKQSSVQLLGAMSHCAPRQLSSALPTIVPKLSESLSDTHPKVQSAAQHALEEVGSVVKNPEIQQLVDPIIAAITKPVENTDASLDKLMETTFVNSVDAPSLALILPVVNRGLRERQANVKKKAAKITGNLCALVDEPMNMKPYVPQLLPELKRAILDPIPEVRGVAAKAVSSLLQGLGESNLDDTLIDWLKEKLSQGSSNIERSGAAQGLAECVGVLSLDRVDELIPDIVSSREDSRSNVKDGHLELLHFLPHCSRDHFAQHLPTVFPCVLDGLADEVERASHVREAALKAGKTLVELYGFSHIDLLLPPILNGVDDANWRIRHCSVQLLGELLFKLSGASGRIQTNLTGEEETVSTQEQAENLRLSLGEDRRNDVLAALYLLRSDTSKHVRSSTDHIWKSIVVNTPRTLVDVMPSLIDRTMASLSSGSEERSATARSNIGEIVRKLGDRMLQTMVPLLKERLEREEVEFRQGACWAVAEIIRSCTKNIFNDFYEDFVSMVRLGLRDKERSVRSAAGEAFGNLIRVAGSDAATEIVPPLLGSLETDAYALEGLKEILKVQPDVLSSVLPKVVVEPLDSFRAGVIGALAEVSSTVLASHLSKLMSALIHSIAREDDEECAQAAETSARRVCLAVRQGDVHLLFGELMRKMEDPNAQTRRATARVTGYYVSTSACDMSEHMRSMMNTLTSLLAEEDNNLVEDAWHALKGLTSRIPKEQLPQYVSSAREAIGTAKEKQRRRQRLSALHSHGILVRGFCFEKGLAPVVDIFIQGMLYSSHPEERQSAADGLKELLLTATPEAVKAHVTSITGPLIRLARERFPWTVKSAILSVLELMIDKGRLGLKPFIPQLQTTFMKCSSEQAKEVRHVAAHALGKLMVIHPKVDTVVAELVKELNSAEDDEGKEASLKALESAFKNAGERVSSKELEAASSAQEKLLASESKDLMRASAESLGWASVHLPEALFQGLVSLAERWSDFGREEREGRAIAFASVCKRSSDRITGKRQFADAAVSSVRTLVTDDQVGVREAAAASAGWLCAVPAGSNREVVLSPCFSMLNVMISDKAAEVRKRALVSVKRVAKNAGQEAVEGFLDDLAPGLAECLTEKNVMVKAKAERCIRRCFNVSEGTDKGIQFVKAHPKAKDKGLTEQAIRRLKGLPDDSEDDDDL